MYIFPNFIQAENISKELKEVVESKHQGKGERESLAVQLQVRSTGQEYLNDVLLLNVMQLFSKLIKFDVLRMTGKPELFYTIVNTFVRFLEYDPKNPAVSYLLSKNRSKSFHKTFLIIFR